MPLWNCFQKQRRRELMRIRDVSKSVWIRLGFPRPQTAARIPISWKRGFRGPKTPISPRPCKGWKREFSVQKSPFSMCSLVEKRGFFGQKTPFSRTKGNGGFWTPKTSFPGNWDSGRCLGSGESQGYVSKCLVSTVESRRNLSTCPERAVAIDACPRKRFCGTPLFGTPRLSNIPK